MHLTCPAQLLTSSGNPKGCCCFFLLLLLHANLRGCEDLLLGEAFTRKAPPILASFDGTEFQFGQQSIASKMTREVGNEIRTVVACSDRTRFQMIESGLCAHNLFIFLKLCAHSYFYFLFYLKEKQNSIILMIRHENRNHESEWN